MGSDFGISIEGYDILEHLGQGGMGTVYAARQLEFDRRVAIKVIHPHLVNDRSFDARFRSEMRIAISLHHPHIVPVYAAGESNGSLFIAMGLVPGHNLADLIEQRGAIAPKEAISYIHQIASALDEAHGLNVIHRDVKPGNVLIDNRVPHAYLTDFGLARSLDASQHLTASGQVALTPEFAAPEQIEAQGIDRRADVYALGCLLFRAITGDSAFRGDSAPSLIWAKMNGSRTPRLAERGLPAALDPIIDSALARARDQRYATAGEFSVAVAAADSGRPPPPPPRPAPTDVSHPVRPRRPAQEALTAPIDNGDGGSSWFRRVGLALGAVALIAIAVGATLVASGSRDQPSGEVVRHADPAPPQETGSSDAGSGQPVGDGQSRRARPPGGGDGAGGFATFTGWRFTADVPRGWVAESIDEPESGTRLVSQWRNPADDNTSVLIDSSDPGPDAPPIDSAATVRAQASQGSGYSEVSFGATTINGQPAAEWVFDIDGDRRVDYFFNSCGMGFAVLGSTSPANFATWKPTFRRVAESITPDCG